jgi:3-hydroxyisobutyrate dehydrogenase
MSTVRPETQQQLVSAVEKAGGAFIECPVSGTTGPARTGQLVGLAGGDVAHIERARPVLAQLCRRIEHIGPIGSGATAKLAINLPLLAFWQSFGEAMALMRHLGKDSQWLVQLFSDTAGTPAVMKVKAGALVETLAGRDSVTPTFDIDSMRKDLRLMLAEAQAGGFPLPLASTISVAFDEAAAAGWGRRDCAWIPAFWANKARLPGT